jgi:hypothetical protein
LVSHPVTLASGDGWQQEHLPTHPEHFYDVHRYTFADAVEIATHGSPHVLSLVKGTAVRLETMGGMQQDYNYAETFVIPAAAEGYRLVNLGDGPAMVVVTFLKREA